MTLLPNCVPQSIYGPDMDIVTYEKDWVKSNVPCPKCNSLETWERETEDQTEFACDECDYQVTVGGLC